ncbi:MAG: protein kinase [Acidobacteriota bacterium]
MDITDDNPANPLIGSTIGVYRLAEEVGRGGMGAVYRAVRVDGEFDQTVAVKLIKRGMDTDLILKRFRRERQILASLNHPNIAYFLGGGSTDDGLPYFVMEYISGKPLYRYCDENHLNLRERLIIFRQICWAVKAAHEIQVIHRDLKPSNIMVKDDGKPKLLDFGIAKVLDPDLTTADMDPTATQMRVMTPEYASPEQISGGTVDVRSDIYSLGVILYELLTGHRPYTIQRRIPEDVARVIREQEPTNPSGCLTRDDDLLPGDGHTSTLSDVLVARNASLETLRRELTGDLDKIVLKTLRKKPDDRYPDAAELADDITNFLDGRAVNAEYYLSLSNIPRPGTPHTMSLAILPFRVIGTTAGEDTGDEFLGLGLADALISRLSGIQRLLVRPTTSVIPFTGKNAFDAGQHLGVDYVLEGSVRMSAGRIRVSVQLLNVADNSTQWARAFDNQAVDVLAIEDSLAEQVTRSLLPQLTGEERRRLEKRGTNRPDAYEAYLRGRYFWSRFTDPDLSRAIQEFKNAIAIDPDYALPYIGLADYYIWAAIFGQIPSMEGFPRASAAARRALEIDDSLGEAYAVLAFSVLLSDWNWTEAEYLVKRALEINPHNAFAHECYSNFLTAQGRVDESMVEIERAEELDPMSPRAMLMTAWTLYQARRYDESVDKARKASLMQQDFPQGLLHLGNALTAVGQLDEAVEVLRKSSELWGDSGMPRYMLCFARAAQGNFEAANIILAKMLATSKIKHVKPYFIAMAYVAVGDHDKAFEWFDKAVEERNEWMIWFGTEPKLDPIRKDPRYKTLLRRINNPMVAKEGYPSANSGPHTGDRGRSIAVLPFHLISNVDTGSSVGEYLSIGLADALTMRLSNIRRFVVRPTSSVLPFVERKEDAFAAGRTLGVDYVIDGLIRQAGGKIRVTAQLLNVANNSTRWSASFAENLGDVLELEDSISEQVTKQLIPHLSGVERKQLAKRGTNIPEAHDAYLQGRFFWNQFTPDGFPKSIVAFRRAVEIDPEYALAHVGIADYFTWACIYGLLPPRECFPKVFEAASRALEIDPSLSEAHAAIGLYYSNIQEWDKCEVSYRRAIELNPNYPLAHEWLSALFVGTGRFVEGINEVLLGERLDPLSLRPKVMSAWSIYQAGDIEQALAKAREIFTLSADFMQSRLQLANCLLETGENDEALEHAERAVELAPDAPLPAYTLCFALAAVGRDAEAAGVVEKWTALSKSTYVPPYFLALSNLAVGNTDAALHYLDEAQMESSAWILWLGTEPKLDRLRDDPRFQIIIERAGLRSLRKAPVPH